MLCDVVDDLTLCLFVEDQNNWLLILNAIITNEVEENDGCLSLTGTTWGAKNITSKLVVRECYIIIINTIRDKEYSNVLLRGTPGIGKSFFLFYFVYSLVKNTVKKIVIAVAYLHMETRRTIYLSVGNGHATVSDSYTSKPDYYFSDSVDIETSKASTCLTVLFASMDEIHFKSFQKVLQQPESNSADMFVPLVPTPELVKMSVSDSMSTSTVQFRSDIYGGSARNCLDNCDHRVDDSVKLELRTYLDEFFADCSETVDETDMDWAATTLAFHLGKLLDDQADLATLERSVVMHQFVHSTELRPLQKNFCSSVMKYVCGHLIQKFNDKLENRLQDLFRRSGSGIFFEAIAFDTMYKNIKDGVVCDLFSVQGEKGNSSTLKCAVSRKVLIRTVSDIEHLREGDVGVPVVGNFPVVDFIVGPNLLQMTIAKSHPVKEERLADIRKALGGDFDSHRLIFVTKAEQIDKFQGCSSLTSISQYVTAPEKTASSSVLGKSNRNESSSSSSKKQSQKKSKKSV